MHVEHALEICWCTLSMRSYSISNFGIYEFMLRMCIKFVYKCWTCAKNLPRHAEDALKNALHMLSICMTPVANWKNLQSENFLLFLLDTFGVVELAYRYIFFFRFILSCQQFDNCSHCSTPVSFTPAANLLRYRWHWLPPVSTTLTNLVEKFSTGVVDTGGAPWHLKRS